MTESTEPDDDKTRTHFALTKGTMVSHYRIIEKIGAGGMGEVYLAEDTKLKRQVALKFLPHYLTSDRDAKARFTREAQAAAKLNHPNIITIHEVSEYQGRPFFAMEHVEGKSLRDLIKIKEASLERVIDLATQICDGLREAHEAGIVHRDIKPSNIILDKKGRPKLLDFGLAAVKGTDKLTRTGSTLGTVGYMSPEQARGQKMDHRSDIFSLGVVLYEMVTGRRPFKGEDDAATLHAITHDAPEPLARYKTDVPDELQGIVDRTLEKDAETRYQTASGMLADLRRLAVSERAMVPAKKKVRRFRWAAAISLLIIVAIWGGLQLKDWLTPAEAQVKSLAVVDFDNIGAEEDAYLASGLAEDLAVKLRQLDGIRVASSADIRRLAKENLLPREIASRLKVQYALGGSLLREDTLVRVNVELIDRESGDVVWSDQIDRRFTEIFQFMDEVSLRIAQALEIRLTPVEKAAMAAKPTDNTAAYDHYLRGRHYYYNITFRDNELAEREFERALHSDPEYPLALAGLADVYVQRYKERFDYDEFWLDSCKVLIEKALEIEPELAEAYESLAELFLEEDNITGAIDAAFKARELRPNWDDPFIHLGNIYKKKGMREMALALYDTALSIRPSVEALCGKGNVYQTRGHVDSAREFYDSAQVLNPHHDRPYLELGGLEEQVNQCDEAKYYYRQAIRVRPDRAAAYERLSYALYNEGSVLEGRGVLRTFVDQYPYNWDGYYTLWAYLWGWLGEPTAAFQVIEEAVRRNPRRAWPHLLLASSYAIKISPNQGLADTMHIAEQAIDAVNQALSLRPHSGYVLEWAGEVYIDLNRMDEGKEFYRRALELRPGSVDLPYELSRVLNNANEFDQALVYALEAVKRAPGNWQTYARLKRAFERLHRADEFYNILQNAADSYGDDPSLIGLLGAEQRLLGRYEEAINTYQLARTIDDASYKTQFSFGLTLWLSGNTEKALEVLKEEKHSGVTPRLIVAILRSEGRFDEVEDYLTGIRNGSTGQKVNLENWAMAASEYCQSMHRYDDALNVFSVLRQSGEETYAQFNTLAIAWCLRQKGNIDSAQSLLEELVSTLSGENRPYALSHLALLSAVYERDLSVANQYSRRAYSEMMYAWAHQVAEPLLRLNHARGDTEDNIIILRNTPTVTWYAGNSYRKAQLAAAYGLNDAGSILNHAILNLTRLTRRYSNLTDVGAEQAFLAQAHALAGQQAEAHREIKRALKLEPEREDIAYQAACVYSLLGDTTLALQWLETAVERGYLELWWARVDPDLDPLRELPRFKEIMTDWDSRIQALLEKSGKDE